MSWIVASLQVHPSPGRRVLLGAILTCLSLGVAQCGDGEDPTPGPDITPPAPVAVSWWLTSGDEAAKLALQPAVWFDTPSEAVSRRMVGPSLPSRRDTEATSIQVMEPSVPSHPPDSEAVAMEGYHRGNAHPKHLFLHAAGSRVHLEEAPFATPSSAGHRGSASHPASARHSDAAGFPAAAPTTRREDSAGHLAAAPTTRLETTPETPLIIEVDPSVRHQTMVGFGAAMTESAAWLIHRALSEEARTQLMTSLFSPTEGIGISHLRVPLGASDFALEDYTYDDQPPGLTDENLTDFSIDHDRQDIIPLLQQARALNPDLELMASPWSPPAWMKTNDDLHGGTLLQAHQTVFAQYLVLAISAYQQEGLDIRTLTIQNEPLHVAGYPSMYMAASEQAALMAILGPMVEASGLTTELLTFDHNWADVAYPDAVLSDPEAAPWIAGTAFHCYDGEPSAQGWLQARFPDKDIYVTECSGGQWSTDFGNNLSWNMANLFIGSVRQGARSVLLWNLALDEASGPTNGGCQDCRGVVTVNQNTGRVQLEVEYYAIGQLSQFVRPGAVRIASTETGQTLDGAQTLLQSVAFENPDGSLVLVVLNAESDSAAGTGVDVTVRWNGMQLSAWLPLQSVGTFVWTP